MQLMKKADPSPSRRNFLQTMTTGATIACVGPSVLQAQKAVSKVKLGFDNFSIRALGWKAPRLLQYAAQQKVDTILFSDLDVYESHDEGYLKEIKQEAKKLGLEIHAGTGGICPTSPEVIFGEPFAWPRRSALP